MLCLIAACILDCWIILLFPQVVHYEDNVPFEDEHEDNSGTEPEFAPGALKISAEDVFGGSSSSQLATYTVHSSGIRAPPTTPTFSSSPVGEPMKKTIGFNIDMPMKVELLEIELLEIACLEFN